MRLNLASSQGRELAEIQYLGLAGISQSCVNAICRLVQFGDGIISATILTVEDERRHCFLLVLDTTEELAVKSGFGSGYAGEGSRAFSESLVLLRTIGAQIDECNISIDFMRRLDNSSLSEKDLDGIKSSERIRPIRWQDYIFEHSSYALDERAIWKVFPTIMPWSTVDSRLVDLAWNFFRNPDECLISGFRRLEDLCRERTKSGDHGSRLFANAFQGDASILTWKGVDSGEQAGRAQLFIGAFLAFRNPRAHRELDTRVAAALPEFLLLNQLFLLERSSVFRADFLPEPVDR